MKKMVNNLLKNTAKILTHTTGNGGLDIQILDSSRDGATASETAQNILYHDSLC